MDEGRNLSVEFLMSACSVLTILLIIETILFISFGIVVYRRKKTNKLFIEKTLFTLQVAQSLRQLISQMSRNSVLKVTNALGELELLEEEIRDDFHEGSFNESTINKIAKAIDDTLCQCLENLQFEDFTAQIREHIQILMQFLIDGVKPSPLSQNVKKSISDKCLQIFSIDEEFEALSNISEGNNDEECSDD